MKASSDYIKGLIEKLDKGTIDEVELAILEEYMEFISEITENNK